MDIRAIVIHRVPFAIETFIANLVDRLQIQRVLFLVHGVPLPLVCSCRRAPSKDVPQALGIFRKHGRSPWHPVHTIPPL